MNQILNMYLQQLPFLALLFATLSNSAVAGVIDTGQVTCYNDRNQISCPPPGTPFYGQDAQYTGTSAAYRDNGDGTVSDLNTGLMWSKAVGPRKLSLEEAGAEARKLTLGGHHDWRVPNIKELYTLMDFRGRTGNQRNRNRDGVPSDAVPYLNSDYFDFEYGNTKSGERFMDAQWLSRTQYVGTTMDRMETLFGVNFADGRIKGYGYRRLGTQRSVKKFLVRYVRGDAYGENDFVDNGNGTISDRSSGMMWTRDDSGRGMNWQQALGYCEGLTTAGHHDWRLPNAKELQYIVDYRRSPDTTGSAAIDPMFHSSGITSEAGRPDYPFYWTSTTHADGPRDGSTAVYVAFGRAIGQMQGRTMDVHGAGAQRSDPKTGNSFLGHGPQGDAVRVNNYVRCVRGGDTAVATPHAVNDPNRYPNNVARLRISGKATGGAEAMGGRQPGYGPESSGVDGGPGGLPGPGGNLGGADGGGVPGFISHLDRDGDGRVSRSEFDGPPVRFDFHDRNRDGYISEEEAPQGPPPGGGMGSNGSGPPRE